MVNAASFRCSETEVKVEVESDFGSIHVTSNFCDEIEFL